MTKNEDEALFIKTIQFAWISYDEKNKTRWKHDNVNEKR